MFSTQPNNLKFADKISAVHGLPAPSQGGLGLISRVTPWRKPELHPSIFMVPSLFTVTIALKASLKIAW